MIKKKLKRFFTRKWDYDNKPFHPAFSFVPPFVFDIFAFLLIASIGLGIIFKILGIEFE